MKAQHSVGIIFFPAYDWGISQTHPEREERLLYTHDQLREEGIFDVQGITEHRPQIATVEDISLVHFCPPGFSHIVEEPHYISTGAALVAGDLVASGKTQKAFALTRPPGHHAMRVIRGGRGFCAVNTEAVMIEKLRQQYGVKRIAVVDTDCHHGDGTQDIFWHDPDTLFISLHQDGRTLYPGTGFVDEAGGPSALGSTINIPLPMYTGDEGYLYAVQHIVRPLLDAWKPDLIVNSAGQDNHFTDPITNMRLTAKGYGDLITAIAPDISVLEGGYSIQGALPYVNLAVVLAMAGLDYSTIEEPALKKKGSTYLTETSTSTMEYIKKLTDHILTRNVHSIPSEYTKKNGWWERERSIYYDTEGIAEVQRERIKDCPHCTGLLHIESHVRASISSTALLTPRNACEQCKTLADETFFSLCNSGHTVEWIDQTESIYKRSPDTKK